MRTISSLVLLVCFFLPPPAAANDGPRLMGRVGVRDPGFATIAADNLRALGVLSGRRVEVRRDGREVATFDAKDGGLVFLAWDHRTAHSAWGVYELFDLGKPITRPTHARADAVPRPLHRRHRVDQDVVFGDLAGGRAAVYAPATAAPTWFLGSIHPGRSFAMDLDPAGAASAQRLVAHVWGTHVGEIALHARWGDHDLGVQRAKTAAGGVRLRWEVPADHVPSKAAPLELVDVSPPPPAAPRQDVSHGRGTIWIDAVTLWGPASHVVGTTPRRFDPLNEGGVLEAEAPLWAAITDEHGGSVPLGHGTRVAFEALSADSRVIAATAAPVREAHAATTPPHPLETAGSAKHVILATPPLLSSAKRLAEHRTATGTPSAVVPVLDVYATYGHGARSPEAIRTFLLDLQPAFVLLAGDATLNRTDLTPFVTIPTPMARTMYNGATSADRLYALPQDGSNAGGASIGRVPFRDAKAMDAWVDRLIAYEAKTPPHPTRRLMRFVTSEGRFGAFLDTIMERMFQMVVTNDLPAAYDIEVTFASMRSAYLWPPPELNDHVIQGFNDGCLFLTYVGHGFAEGFDSLRVGSARYPILTTDDVPKVHCRGIPPCVMVLACTTAIFDLPSRDGIGEKLLANPEGPVAYWGATRICHPAANTLLGRSLAQKLAGGGGRLRLGEILDRARDAVLAPTAEDPSFKLIKAAIPMLAGGADAGRLAAEGSWMYTLLGDPATKVAFPRNDLTIEATRDEKTRLTVRVRGEIPEGTDLHVSIEVPRNRRATDPEPVEDPSSPAAFPTVRKNHAAVNDLRLAHRTVKTGRDGVRVVFEIDAGVETKGLIVKAWAATDADVHQGALRLLE